jgi:hypothetical protein
MHKEAIDAQRRMQSAVHELHQSADALVNEMEARQRSPAPLDDDEQAALDGARRWRSLIESGAAD